MHLWHLVRSFGRRSLTWMAVLLAALGLASAAINDVLGTVSKEAITLDEGFGLLLRFLALLVVAKAGIFAILVDLTDLVQRANARIQLRLMSRVVGSDIGALERLGLGEAINIVSRCAGDMAAAVNHIAALIFPAGGMMGIVVVMLFWPGQILLGFLAGLAALLSIWWVFQRILLDRHERARAIDRAASQGLAELGAGFKEIRLMPQRGTQLQAERIAPAVRDAARGRIEAGELMALNSALGGAIPMILMGITGLLLPAIWPELAMAGAVAATVIIMLPADIITSVGSIARANSAYGEIAELFDRLEPLSAPEPPPPGPFTGIALRGASFAYPGEAGFRVGPIDLDIPAGKISFIVGGNGSGKSTVMKLLAGIYRPAFGEVLINGQRCDPRGCQDLFSLIFADFHLFDRLYGRRDADPAKVAALLEEFGLSTVTRFENGGFTVRTLSTGQRKRLAMVVALLDDRPVLLLDEWAADQDPPFRTLFYETLLPRLREAGKTVVAVSHDDRFFHVADQVIALDYGRRAVN